MSRHIDTLSNSPFTPGYGRQPLVFGGHREELEEIVDVFTTFDFGDNHSILVSGLRGSGKTSMLTKLQDEAKAQGWLVISDDASRGLMDRVMESTIPHVISTMSGASRKRLSALGIWHFSAQWEFKERDRTVKPMLRNDLIALSEHSDNSGVLITIDEVSAGKVRLRELSRFALEISHAMEQGANIMVVFAGVKVDLDALLQQEHVTFLRRSKELDFRRLTPPETRRVLAKTAEIGGRRFTPEALDLLIRVSQGYPYLVQLLGDYAWRASPTADPISIDDARLAQHKGVKAIERRVISRVYDDLSDKDKDFLMAMARDEERSKMSDIVSRMQVSPQYAQGYKKRLINSGYVQADGHGFVRFSLPYLGQYVRGMLDEDVSDDDQGRDDDWANFPPPAL